jgi:predicted HicB family RNase H-like nuclease
MKGQIAFLQVKQMLVIVQIKDVVKNWGEIMKVIHFRIDEEFKKEIEIIAKDKGLSTASYIKMILKEKIQEHKNKKG